MKCKAEFQQRRRSIMSQCAERVRNLPAIVATTACSSLQLQSWLDLAFHTLAIHVQPHTLIPSAPVCAFQFYLHAFDSSWVVFRFQFRLSCLSRLLSTDFYVRLFLLFDWFFFYLTTDVRRYLLCFIVFVFVFPFCLLSTNAIFFIQYL